MQTITAIYLNCKPALRDEWLAVTDMTQDLEDSLGAENTLRQLLRFYHTKHYGNELGPFAQEALNPRYGRSDSLAQAGPGVEPGSIDGHQRGDSDVFPPSKTTLHTSSSSDYDYNPDVLMGAWMIDYEHVIEGVLGIDNAQDAGREGISPRSTPLPSPHFANVASQDNTTAWVRLEQIIESRSGKAPSEISDSESVVSIGELGEDARLPFDDEDQIEEDPIKERQRRKSSGNENTWEVCRLPYTRTKKGVELTINHTVPAHSTSRPNYHCCPNHPMRDHVDARLPQVHHRFDRSCRTTLTGC